MASITVPCQANNVCSQDFRKTVLLLFCPMLQEVLHDEVAIRVPAEFLSILEYVLGENTDIRAGAMLEQPFDDAAAKTAPCKECTKSLHLLDDKADMIWSQGLHALLQNVVGMGTFQGFLDVPTEAIDQGNFLRNTEN